MTRTRVALGILVWLVVVAGASTLVWLVISHAGDEPATPEQPLVARTDETGSTARTTPDPTAAGAEQRTWQGTAGLVIASCEEDAIRLVSAQPVSGFHAEVKDEGPDELEVEFEAREESGNDATVVARCVSGVPDFAAGTEDD